MIKVILSVSCFFWFPQSHAEYQINEPVGLFLSPDRCLLSSAESFCQITLNVRWKTATIGDYCLIADFQNAPLQCWNAQNQNSFDLELKLTQPVSVALIEQDSHLTLFSQSVQLHKQLTQYRKKRRNPWQFY